MKRHNDIEVVNLLQSMIAQLRLRAKEERRIANGIYTNPYFMMVTMPDQELKKKCDHTAEMLDEAAGALEMVLMEL